MNKKTLKNYLVILVVMLVLLAGLSIYVQGLAETQETGNAFIPEDQTGNINNQFISIAVLFLMGFLVLFPFESKINTNHLMILSFIIGFITISFISTFLLLSRIELSLLSIFITYFGILAVIAAKVYIIDKQRHHKIKDKLWCMAFWLILFSSLGYFFCKTNFSILTFDSIQYKNLANSYANFGSIAPHTYYTLVGHSFIPAIPNTISVLFGFDLAYGVQNLFMMNCALLFGYLTYEYTKTFDIKRPLLTSLVPTTLFATSFFVVFLSMSLVPNMYAGYFMFLFIIYIERYRNKENPLDIVFAFIFAVAFCFTRIEGSLIIAFILAYLAHDKLPAKTILRFTCYITVIIVFYFWTILSLVGFSYESPFLTFDKSILIVSILLIIVVYTKLKEKYFMSKNDLLLKIYLSSTFVFSAVLCLMDIPKFIANVSALYTNMFAQGMWFITWFIVIIFTCIALILNRGEAKKSSISYDIIYIYCVLLFAIFAFRSTNLHDTWSDSGNRMLMHIFPLIVFSIYNSIIYYFQKK